MEIPWAFCCFQIPEACRSLIRWSIQRRVRDTHRLSQGKRTRAVRLGCTSQPEIGHDPSATLGAWDHLLFHYCTRYVKGRRSSPNSAEQGFSTVLWGKLQHSYPPQGIRTSSAEPLRRFASVLRNSAPRTQTAVLHGASGPQRNFLKPPETQ